MKVRTVLAVLLLMVTGCTPKVVSDVDNIKSVPFEAFLFCPNDSHPHAIDLGLPSGTKWCCCNVGASSPEGYGNYYSYGNEKGNRQYVNFDIVCTSNDVAHVCIGTPWQMPSVEQMKELYDNCSRKQTLQNGVNGILVTGSNGGQIFLPSADWHRIDELDLEDSADPLFNSSSLPLINSYYMYELYFYFGGWCWDNYYSGLSVRAVCP